MAFIDAQAGRVNFQVFEFRTNQTQPSDPSFEFMVGKDCEKFLKAGLTHEVIGPDPKDCGPFSYCVCSNGETAKQIRSALELLNKL